MSFLKTVLCLVALMISQVYAKALDVVLTEHPIEIRLPIDKEIIIKFPMPVTHTNTLNEESSKAFSTLLTPNGVLYITAIESFDKTRMVAELVDGRLVMLDLVGTENGPFSDINIIEQSKETSLEPETELMVEVEDPLEESNPYKPSFLADGEAKTRTEPADNSLNRDEGGSYHKMVQFGFRTFVGPQRLIGNALGERISSGKKKVSGLLRIYDAQVSMQTLAQWKIDGQYLTVLLVNNKSNRPIEFDPRMIRGRWVFAAALYPVIEPRGNRFDQTLWALISKVPFEQARRVP